MNSPARAVTPLPSAATARATLERVATNLSLAVQGKEKEVRLAVTCVVAGGHLLLEDVPGVGKTTLAEALARSCALSFARVQFTADLMPADILGAQVFHAQSATFTLPARPPLPPAGAGRRAQPRAAAHPVRAARGHGPGTGVPGWHHPHRCPAPSRWWPRRTRWTSPAPIPCPTRSSTASSCACRWATPPPRWRPACCTTRDGSSPVEALQAVTIAQELIALRALVAAQRLDDTVADYVVRLAQATRTHGDIERGASTRAVLALGMAARAQALWESRDFVTPGDVRAVLGPVSGPPAPAAQRRPGRLLPRRGRPPPGGGRRGRCRPPGEAPPALAVAPPPRPPSALRAPSR